MNIADYIGSAAGICTTASFLPQIVRTLRTRSVRDISFGMITLFFGGITLWLVYGILKTAWPIILTNTVTLLLVLILLICKIAFTPRSADPASRAGRRDS